MRSVCEQSKSGEVLIHSYFHCRDLENRLATDSIEWEAIRGKLKLVAPELRTSVGLFPRFSKLCPRFVYRSS